MKTLQEAAEAYRKAKQREVDAIRRESEAVSARISAESESRQAHNDLLLTATGGPSRCARGTVGCERLGMHVGFECLP